MGSFDVFTESKSLDFGEKDAFGFASCYSELKESENSGIETERETHVYRKYAK